MQELQEVLWFSRYFQGCQNTLKSLHKLLMECKWYELFLYAKVLPSKIPVFRPTFYALIDIFNRSILRTCALHTRSTIFRDFIIFTTYTRAPVKCRICSKRAIFTFIIQNNLIWLTECTRILCWHRSRITFTLIVFTNIFVGFGAVLRGCTFWNTYKFLFL